MDTAAMAPSRDEVISRVSAHRSELRSMGITYLALFGSVARDDAAALSDVDMLVDVPPMSLFSIIRIEHYLTDLLGRKVDLVPLESVRAEFKAAIEAEAVRVI
jgi:predicted nucleotidyltransferase